MKKLLAIILCWLLCLLSLTASAGTIQDLIDEGALVGYWDFRAGHARDLSGNGNHGTPTDVVWGRDGAMFPAATSVITVADSAELQLTEGSLVAFSASGFFSTDYQMILSKQDAGGRNYATYLYPGPDRVFLVANIGEAAIVSTSAVGKKMIGISFDSLSAGDLHIDGVLSGAFSGSMGFDKDDADLKIGNYYTGNAKLESTLSAVLIFNRVLTATEHAQVYAELAARRWPTQHTRRWSDWLGTGAAEGWGTGWGSPVTENRTAGQFVGPFEIISGTHKVTTDTIDGKLTKVVECVADGVIAIPVSAMGQTPDEAAYGTWDLWVNKADASVTDIGLVCQVATAPAAGDYGIELAADETLILREPGGAAIVTGTVAADTWQRIMPTRTSPAGLWDVEVEGVSQGTGTDATITSGSYFTIDMDAGDKIALSDLGGGHGLKKYLGVVSP